jgi:hypothetical protein
VTYLAFSPKDPSEVIVVSFGFFKRLDAGETVTASTFTVEVLEGIDPDPSALLSGEADLSSLPVVKQKLIGGLLGVTYLIKALATTSSTRKIMGARTLKIVDGGTP